MRTRFIATDYSAAAAAAVADGGREQALEFVQLPLPQLSPSNHPSFATDIVHSFADIQVLDISSEIEKLPIDDALSIFLSDVLPHFINSAADFEERRIKDKENLEVLPSQRSRKICYREKELDRLNADKAEIEEEDGKKSDGTEFLQFEIPETNTSLLPPQKCATDYLIEGLQVVSTISDPECAMDLLSSELRLDHQVQGSVYSVDHMKVEYQTEKKPDLLDDSGSVEAERHSLNMFPLFEVDVESLGAVGLYTRDEILSFENVCEQNLEQPDQVSNNELLGSLKFDLMELLLHPCIPEHSLENSILPLQSDNVTLIELSYSHAYSASQKDKDPVQAMDSFLFDEIRFFDLDPYNFHEVFSDAAEKINVVTCDSMFSEAMNFKSFSQLIVCHELTPMDASFKSLPVPIFSDLGNTSFLYSLMEEVFSQLPWQSSSASDGLYLDWDYLTEDDGYVDKYPSCWKMLLEINSYEIDVAMNLTESEKMITEFVLSEVEFEDKHADNYKEISKSRTLNTFQSEVGSNILKNDGDRNMIMEGHLLKTSTEKVPVFGESMSSDLEFFLNPRNYSTGRESLALDKSVDKNTMCQAMSSGDSNAADVIVADQKMWNVKLHIVKLSDNILLLIDHLSENYLALLKDKKELLHMQHQYQDADDLTLLHLPKENMMIQLKEKIASRTYLAQDDDDVMVLAMLCAIKQMAFYLCYYGVQTTYLYVNKLSTSFQCLKSRLSTLCDLIRNELGKSENELNIIHPSISISRDILQANLSNTTSKILIVSDQVFWSSLKRLTTSLRITYCELPHHCDEITDAIMDVILCSNCCLLSHEFVSPTFPFSKFSCILEYGGSNGSSRVSSICPGSNTLPTLYYLKVDLGESSIAKALTHGVNMPKSTELEIKRDLCHTSEQQQSLLNLEQLLSTIPVEETQQNEPVEATKENDNPTKPAVPLMPLGSKSEENLSCVTCLPDAIVIVNTRNLNDEMIISRRSTYQRILEMEKEGAQIVERDVSVPVDVIVSVTTCITWYNSRNIGKKASAPDEAFSCLPLCVESIATNILTSLSYAFSCCILIFEGDDNFLISIMESSDELYAAAASLRIDIQVFFSHSCEMTEQILLSVINVAAKLSRGLYPKMSESESLGEYFLTACPSVNPLSAHAILSSGDVLGKFMEMSNECRTRALKQYQVPEESVALLSATIRYGEREDSKSGLTDSSSSLSSIPENIQLKNTSDRKRPKYSHNVCPDAELPHDLFLIGSVNLLPDDKFNPPILSVSDNSCRLGSPGTSDKPGQSNLFFKGDIFKHNQEFVGKGVKKSDEMGKPWVPKIDLDISPGWRSKAESMINSSRQGVKTSETPQNDFTGEVINIEDSPTFGQKFSVPSSSSLSPFLLEVERDYAARNSRMSKLTSGSSNLPEFKYPIDLDSFLETGLPTKDKEQILEEETKPQLCNIAGTNNYIRCQNELLHEDNEAGPTNSYMPYSQENGTQNSSGTPLSNALYSTQQQQGSPWTIEFLNRVREKSRLRKQSSLCNLSSPCLGLGNTSITKRKSPSMIEFYKYEGGNTPLKTVPQKRQKRSSKPWNSQNEKASTSYIQSSTPVDKRSRRTLSFATNGMGGQSKLVWRDDNPLIGQRRF